MLLIKNATVYAPEYLGRKDILLGFDRILAVGEDLGNVLPDTDVLDASGLTAIPGFIDQHVHVTGGGGEGGLHTRVPEVQLSSIIRAGVTTVVGLLGTDGVTRSVESLLAKTKALQNEGITAYCLTSSYQYPPHTLTGSVGRDMVFLSEVLGCKLALSDHRGSHPTREELIRLVSEIRMAALVGGKPGLLHIHVGADPAGIRPIMDIVDTTDIPIRHFRPTHMGRHLEQAAEFTRMGGFVDISAGPEVSFFFTDLLEQADPALITVSSDANGSLPRWDAKREKIVGLDVAPMDGMLDVLRELVKGGMSLAGALPFFTSNVARALELYPRKGTVRPGSDADLVLVDDSLTVRGVLARGRVMMWNGELLAKGTFEN